MTENQITPKYCPLMRGFCFKGYEYVIGKHVGDWNLERAVSCYFCDKTYAEPCLVLRRLQGVEP